jgi:hypothetical protein
MRLILHAGTHKTGTKTLQHCLFANRKALASAGLAYPILEAEAGERQMRSNNWLAHAFTAAYAITPSKAVVTVEQAARRVGDAGIVLASAEDSSACCLGMRLWRGLDRPDFRDLQRDYLAKIASAFSRFDILPVLMFRRADEFAQSLYQTIVGGNHFTGSFESFLSYAAPLLDYEAQRAVFATVFARVEVLSFHGPNIVHRLLAAAGVDFGLEPPPTKNVSTDARLTYWLNWRATARKPTVAEVSRRKRFLKSDAVRTLFPDFGEASFWGTEADRAAFHDRCTQEFSEFEFPPPRRSLGPDARVDEKTLQRISECYAAWKESTRCLDKRG